MAIRKTVIKRYESQAWVDIYPVTAWAYIENIPSTFPPSAHTHNYAGSSSAGGDANNAVKLNGQAASYYLNYNNFTNTPTIPTKTSQLTNDSGYLTSSTLTGDIVIDALGYTPGTSNFTGYTSSNKLSTSYISGLATVATSGSYNDLSNKPTIPTKASWNYDDRYVRYDTASQGLNATQKSNARTNIGAGTSNFSGSYNDLTNKPTIPTKVSQLTNDSGYLTSSTLTGDVVIDALGYTPGTYSKPSGGIPASDLAQTYYLASNPNGYTSNIGTVTTVKLGSTSYSPTSGVISLPAYPTTLPASDVYSWAKAATKPSYTHNEIGAGHVIIGDGANYVLYRTHESWRSGYYYHTTGNEAVVFANKNASTSWIFVNAVDPTDRKDWTNLGQVPAMQIKTNSVAINKLIGNGATPSYNLDVNGTANATTLYENGTSLTDKYAAKSHTHSQYLTGITKDMVTTALGYTPPQTDTNTWRKVQLNGVDKLGNATNTNPLNIKNGSGISITESSGAFTFALNLTGDLVVDALGYTPGTSNFSGSYNDLSNKPTIPTKVSQLSNDSGYITGITSSMVTTALGYTPANSSHNHNYITTVGDNRSVATKPNDYNNIFRFQGLKTNTVIGSPSSDTYSYLIGLRGWSDSSGGNSWELAFTNTAIFVRNGATTSWGSWYRLAYKSEIPTKVSQLSNDSGYITGITSSMVTTALGFTPLSTTGTAADSSKLNGQAASYYLNYNNLSNKPTIYTDCVRYVSQSLTDAQKTQARSNIGAGTSNFTGYTSSNKLSTSYISGLATVATSGSYNDLTNKPTIPNVPSWALQSTKPSYDASEISCDAFGDDVSSILQAMDSAIGGKAASNHTHDTRYVRFDTASQGLNSTQKSNARTNIGAGTGNGTVTSVSVKINGTVKGTVTTSGTIDLGTIGGGGVEIGFVGYLYFNDDRNTPVWFEISAAGYGLSEGLYIIAPEDSYPGFKTDNARYWQGAISRLSATEGSFKLWKTRGDSCGYVQFTYSSQTSVTITSSDCAADYGKFIIYKVMNVNEP